MLAGPLDMNNGLADLTQAGRVDHAVARALHPGRRGGAHADRVLRRHHHPRHPGELPETPRAAPVHRRPAECRGAKARRSPARSASTSSWPGRPPTAPGSSARPPTKTPRELDIPLAFLPAGQHEALVIQDGDDSDYRTHAEGYKAETREVTTPTRSASSSPPVAARAF